MHATHNALSENIRTQSAEHVRRRHDPDVAEPLRRLDAWRNEGGTGRSEPL